MIKLIGVLVAGIPALIATLLASWSRKWVIVTAAIALMITLTAGFIAVINGLVQSLAGSLMVPGWMANAIGMFIPSNFGMVIGLIVSAHIARAAYDLAMAKTLVFAQGN